MCQISNKSIFVVVVFARSFACSLNHSANPISLIKTKFCQLWKNVYRLVDGFSLFGFDLERMKSWRIKLSTVIDRKDCRAGIEAVK